jgi:diaminohydroxyphosphoribosylaminopyrimidine deaminase/5-amino-6-(5-phosphoribosylamino)uracil reductase
MNRCLELAKLGEYSTAPNPMVGCVIVYNNSIVAEGYHEKYGSAHAEVNAFSNLSEDIDPSKCEVYVNLEPCSFYGKTPPCAELIVAKKPKRIVIGMLDPHKKVAGSGVKRILEAGIDLKVGVLEDECKELNKKFIKAHTEMAAFVTLKWAETSDGYMARKSNSKESAKISDPINNVNVHRLRANHQAILVGAQTVNRDNPSLNLRHWKGNNPIKVVLSPRLSVNLSSKIFEEGRTLVYNQKKSSSTNHYELIQLADCSIDNILKDLVSRDIHSILVEGGPTVLGAFINKKIWDEAIILKSNDSWGEGIKAPWVGIKSRKEETQGNDTIKYFKPK